MRGSDGWLTGESVELYLSLTLYIDIPSFPNTLQASVRPGLGDLQSQYILILLNRLRGKPISQM